MTDTSGTAKTPKMPSPKAAMSMEGEVHDDKKEKPAKEKDVLIIHDHDFFRHETGDTYDGEFEARKKDHTVKMQGNGVYTTAEGDSYSGQWDNDKIVATQQTIISYKDGANFKGILKEWGYSGKGTYTYPDGSVLTGEFSDNCPVGNLVLSDPNGHTWLGKADSGFGWFEPVNHFYELLETTQTRIKRRHKTGPADTAKRHVAKTSLPSNKTASESSKAGKKTAKK